MGNPFDNSPAAATLVGRMPCAARWILAVASIAVACVWPARGDERENAALEKLLGRLGLVDLQIRWHERQLAAPSPAPQRIELARKLADLYAASLVSTAGDPERYAELSRRVEALLARVPEANTPSLQVVLLEADFTRAEKLLLPALLDPSLTGQRDEARQVLAKLAPQLLTLMRDRNAAADRLAAELDGLKDEPPPEREAELQRVQVVAARATYLAGWTNYYAGLLAGPEAAGRASLTEARGALRKLLAIDEAEEYGKISADTLGLESEGRARAMIALGQVEAALGNLDAAAACFGLLDSTAAAPTLRDQAASFHLQGLVYAGRFAAALALAEKEIAAWQGSATRGQTLFCVTLVRAAKAASGVPETQHQMLTRGLAGLVKQRQIGAARQLVKESGFDVSREPGFYFRWLEAQEQYLRAEASKKPEDYRAAAAALAAALGAPDAQTEVAVAADCRYFLGWCHYKLGDHEAAATAFQQAAAGRKASDPAAAADAAWMAFVSYQPLAAKEPRFADAAIAVLEGIARDFPDSSYAGKVAYQIARLRDKATSPAERIASLSRIAPTDPNYLAARFDMCRLQVDLWRQADAAGKAAAALVAQKSIDTFLAAAAADGDQERKLRATLLAAELALGAQPHDQAVAARYLEQAGKLAAGVAERRPVLAEYHYLALRWAQRGGDQATLERHADWLVHGAAGTPYEAAALVIVARRTDAALATAPAEERAARLAEAVDIYARLSRHYGNSPAVLAEQKNAQVAASKLAGYLTELGRHEEAARTLAPLLAAFPKELSYLRRAGLAEFAAGHFDRALPHWRTLLAGLNSGAAGWHEAKYYQLACLAKLQPPQAREAYQQYELLHGSTGPAPWRDKIKELGRMLR